MNRRTVLAGAALAVSGCTTIGYSNVEGGGSSDGGAEPRSEGDDESPIEAPVEDLLLSVEDFEADGWSERETDDEHCREFERGKSDERALVSSCAWVYEDGEEAEDEYETKVERTWKQSRGSPADEEPPVGTEATAIPDRTEVHVIFRDANAVGAIDLRHVYDGPGFPDTEPGLDEAVEYAAAMHERWRD